MASFFSFSQPIDVDIRLEGEDKRKQVELKMDKDRRENCPIYFDGEGVSGQVRLCSCKRGASWERWTRALIASSHRHSPSPALLSIR